MPKFLIPQLTKNIQALGTCIIVHNPSEAGLAWTEENAVNDAVVVFSDEGEDRWLEWSINSWEDDGEKAAHLHLELSRSELIANDTRVLSLNDLASVCGHFVDANEGRTASIRVQAQTTKTIPFAALPPAGLAQFFTSGSTKAKSMKVAGVNLQIDDELFTKIIVNREGDNAQAYLFARAKLALGYDTYQQMASLMEHGINKYLFEKSLAEKAP